MDWRAEREAFLLDVRSARTAEAYRRAVDHLGTWLELHNLPAANLTPRLADDFIRDIRAISGRDADTVRLVVSARSSFFTFLECRFDEIRNPFRGSRARPASTWTEAVIPTAKALEVLQAGAEPALRAALSVPIETGLRLDGLPSSESGRTEPGTRSRRHTACSPRRRSPRGLSARCRQPGWIPAGPSTRRHSRGDGPGDAEEGSSPDELLVAWLKTRLARLCAQLVIDEKLGAV